MRRVTIVVLAAFCGGATYPASAQSTGSYPNRPIRLVMPASPGGPVDVIGRTMGAGLAEALGQTIVMDNRAGAWTGVMA
jgi:tripartite-type tricarboxylate transporter receptor subunit TctC